MNFAADGVHSGATVLLPYDSVRLNSEDDENWQLIAGNCVLNFNANTTNQSSEDIRYRKSFEQGFADASNPGHDELAFSGKASFVGQVAGKSEMPIACDAQHIYWISLVRVPRAPGFLGVELMILNGYRLQTTEQRIIFFKKQTFLTNDKRPAQQIGGVAAAIATVLRK